MKNYFKEAKKIIKQYNIETIKRKKNHRKHLIYTIDSLISSGISVFDLEVVNKNAIKFNYRDKIKKQEKIIDLMARDIEILTVDIKIPYSENMMWNVKEIKEHYERKVENEEK